MLSWLVDRYWRWRAAREEAAPKPWEASLRAAGFYPAYADWAGVFGADAAGQVRFAEHGAAWSARRPVTEPELRFAARAVAARRHPDVPALALVRQPGDPDCPSCGGSGEAPVSPRHRH